MSSSDEKPKSSEDDDPTWGNNAVTQDFADLKRALFNVKQVLTPYDWVEFAQEYETQRALKLRQDREEKERRLKEGEDSDDEPEGNPERIRRERFEQMSLNEHIKGRIVEVQGFFTDVIQSLLTCHSHLTEDWKLAQRFVAVMKFVPKNSRDVVERLTERNNELEEKCAEYEARFLEIEEFETKRKQIILAQNETFFVNLKEHRLVQKVWTAFRSGVQSDLLTRWRKELQELRIETKNQKRAIKKLTDEVETLKRLLDSFRSKHEKQVKLAQEQMAKLHELEDTLEKLTEQIRILESDKKNLEISLKDEVGRRKDAEYALERTQEELARKTEEFNTLEEQYTDAMGRIDELTTKLKIAEETLARETERMEKERIEMERIMGAAQEQINMLKVELAQLEERMMIKVSELTSALQLATAENIRLEAERSRLEIELAATLKQWKEDVEKVKREAAEEIERRGKAIYEAFADERETHVRRLKIQNYELAKRDMYVALGPDLNPLPVHELQQEVDRKSPSPNHKIHGKSVGPNGDHIYCVQCRKQVVYEELKEKKLLELYSSPVLGTRNTRGGGGGANRGRSLSPQKHGSKESRIAGGKVASDEFLPTVRSNSKQGDGRKPVVMK